MPELPPPPDPGTLRLEWPDEPNRQIIAARVVPGGERVVGAVHLRALLLQPLDVAHGVLLALARRCRARLAVALERRVAPADLGELAFPRAQGELELAEPFLALEERARIHNKNHVAAIGLARDDAEGREKARLLNFEFFGARCAVIIFMDKSLTH